VIEHAGAAPESVQTAIVTALARRYGRPITGVTRRNDALIAGLRVRVGDDVYESSVAGQLAALSSAV
jgi:F-type H+-transporting ATPase subunit delta